MSSVELSFTAANFHQVCDSLAKKDRDLRKILKKHGFPPMWTRPATFQTLVLTILEQQVSLASAYAAFKKLREKIGYVTPSKIIVLSDSELRSCYFSRQKKVYVRELASAAEYCRTMETIPHYCCHDFMACIYSEERDKDSRLKKD